MHQKLYASCSVCALAAAMYFGAVSVSTSADASYVEERVSAAFEPTKYLSIEGGFLLNDSDTVLSFDPEDDKFGALPPLDPGQDGWQASAEFGSRIDPVWDYRVGASLIDLGTESGQALGDSVSVTDSTDLRIGYADAEVGFRPDFGSGVGLRLFGGIRGLVASATSSFEDGEDKFGDFDDSTWAIGPRVGAGIAVPVYEERGISFVGSVAGAALFGKRDSDYSFVNQDDDINLNQSFSDSVTIWNAEAMAGFSMPLTASANVTLGYKAQLFSDLTRSRSNINQVGEYTDDGESDVLVHGPFVKMTIALD